MVSSRDLSNGLQHQVDSVLIAARHGGGSGPADLRGRPPVRRPQHDLALPGQAAAGPAQVGGQPRGASI